MSYSKADLHLHTYFSDGKFSVEELLLYAKRRMVEIISITDHDNTGAIDEAIEKTAGIGMELIPGIEFSTNFLDSEVHILSYFFNHKDSKITDYVKNFREKRIQRLDEMIGKLNYYGYKLSLEELLEDNPGIITLGRPHLANILVKKGYVKNYYEAFTRFIGDYKICFVRKPNPPVEEVLELISDTKGIAVLAHPGASFSMEFIEKLIKLEIDGIETVHPSHTLGKIKKLENFAKEKNLLATGGSDFHGYFPQDFTNLGKYVIPADRVGKMRAKIKEKHLI